MPKANATTAATAATVAAPAQVESASALPTFREESAGAVAYRNALATFRTAAGELTGRDVQTLIENAALRADVSTGRLNPEDLALVAPLFATHGTSHLDAVCRAANRLFRARLGFNGGKLPFTGEQVGRDGDSRLKWRITFAAVGAKSALSV